VYKGVKEKKCRLDAYLCVGISERCYRWIDSPSRLQRSKSLGTHGGASWPRTTVHAVLRSRLDALRWGNCVAKLRAPGNSTVPKTDKIGDRAEKGRRIQVAGGNIRLAGPLPGELLHLLNEVAPARWSACFDYTLNSLPIVRWWLMKKSSISFAEYFTYISNCLNTGKAVIFLGDRDDSIVSHRSLLLILLALYIDDAADI
jgi:hypothetical protein